MSNNDNHDNHYKLVTRRYIAWIITIVATGTVAFIAVWGAVKGQSDFVTLACGGLIGVIGSILGFYFGKKTSED